MTPVGPSGEPSVRAQRSPPTPELIIALSDLVSLKASDVGMTDLAVGPSRTAGDGSPTAPSAAASASSANSSRGSPPPARRPIPTVDFSRIPR